MTFVGAFYPAEHGYADEFSEITARRADQAADIVTQQVQTIEADLGYKERAALDWYTHRQSCPTLARCLSSSGTFPDSRCCSERQKEMG